MSHGTVASVTAFGRWCAAAYGAPVTVADDTPDAYAALHRWSVAEPGQFWGAVAEYFGVVAGRHTPEQVLARAEMPGAVWFPGARVNYVEYLFRDRPAGEPALVDMAESADGGDPAEVRTLTWAQLRDEVAAFTATLRRLGVGPGDRVVGYLPSLAEGVVAFLGAAAVGAVWASCGQDYAPRAAAARFAQLEPAVLVAADGYRFNGRPRPRLGDVEELHGLLPSLLATVVIPRLGEPVPAGALSWTEAVADVGKAALETLPLPFDHPLWVLFSSGTTGRPKGIVHGHGGVLLEHVKVLALHNGLGRGDRFHWYASPSWMVWNYLVSGLLVGATVVVYDGSPTFPGPDGLWRIAAAQRLALLGSSPGYLAACQRAGAEPGRTLDLAALRGVYSSGSPLPAAAYRWVSANVGPEVQVVSTSGGTDVVSAFAGSAPTLPTWPAELSAPCLGVALEVWDADGHAVPAGTEGELVITTPMPSMPLRLWDDRGDIRYRATYFAEYPGVWRHGDRVTLTVRGSVIVHGRSDSTLNLNGVRMGTADLHDAVEGLPEVEEALVIGAEQAGGGYWMPLFVRLVDGAVLDEPVRERIRARIRSEVSPRYLPDDIRQVGALPHTRTGKKLEVPVKRLLQGVPLAQVVDPDAVDDATLLDAFLDYRHQRLADEGTAA